MSIAMKSKITAAAFTRNCNSPSASAMGSSRMTVTSFIPAPYHTLWKMY